MNQSNLEHAKARNARTIGAVVATVCAMGLVGALWLHPEHPMAQIAGTSQSGPTAAASEAAFLHAPATASAIPSAEQVFASRRGASEDDAPAAPTF